jgi:hypothetical protein
MWMFDMATCMHQCRSVGLPVHDSRDSSSDLNPTFYCCFSSFPLTSIYSLSPNVLPAGGIITEVALVTMDGSLIISSGTLAISDSPNVILSGCLVILTPSRMNVDA